MNGGSNVNGIVLGGDNIVAGVNMNGLEMCY